MSSLVRIARFMAPYRKLALLAPLLMALEVAMDLALPRLLQTLVDDAVATGDLELVLWLGGAMLSAALLGAAAGVGCAASATVASLHFGADVRAGLFRKTQELSFGNLDRLRTGSLITRLTSDVDRVQEAAAMFLRILVRAPFLLVGSVAMAVVTSPSLSPVLLVIVPLLAAVLVLIQRRAGPLFNAVQGWVDGVNGVLQENLAGVRVVRTFAREDHEAARFGRVNEGLTEETVRASSLMAASGPLLMLLLNCGIAAALWIGGHQVQQGQLQIGQILAFVSYLLQVMFSLMMIAFLLRRVAQAEASAGRILEVLDTEPELPEAPDGQLDRRLSGRVQLEAVSFSRRIGPDGGQAGQPILQDVSLTLEPGRTVALVGGTGSGKSTLLQLLARLYDVSGGRILLDGQDVRSLPLDNLRRQVAIVLQETVLFSGTVRDNICAGRPGATDEEVEQAARLAQAHRFIRELPDGYATVLARGGSNLSGGQRQRLALARALITRPAVLLLDDCTSAVDTATEARILEGLASWEHRCTKVLIAQRLAPIAAADEILLLDEGTVAASGSHTELLRSSPRYRELLHFQRPALEADLG